MKQRITDYVFNAGSRTVTFTGFAQIDLAGVLLIVNTVTNDILYNFADASKGGTAVGNVLTLDFNTSSMGNSDSLLIYYDSGAALPVNAATATAQAELSTKLSSLDALFRQVATLVNRLSFLSTIVDTVGSVRATILSGTITSVSTVSTVNTVTGVTNQQQTGGYYTNLQVMSDINTNVASAIRANIVRT